MVEIGTITYAADVTPWTSPTTGNFTISLAAARGAGVMEFVQKKTDFTEATVGKPDIGAAPHGGVFPAVADVEDAVTYGAAGTEYEGEYPTVAQIAAAMWADETSPDRTVTA